MALLELAPNGLYCPAGDFYIDPWGLVDRAIITHAHAAAAHAASRSSLTAKPGEALLRARLGPDAVIESLDYGVPITMGSIGVSLHPAGHILGSAQVRLEHAGEVWVVSGHYKLAPDATCAPFEPLRCHTFVTEATYGLPIFRWRSDAEILDAIHLWWRANQEAGRASLLFAHPSGKAQRLLARLDSSLGPIYCHEAVESINEIYRRQEISLAPTKPVSANGESRRALILAPISAHGSPVAQLDRAPEPLEQAAAPEAPRRPKGWSRRFSTPSTALASGWMRIRGTRRRRSLDRGFAFSDHADWPALLRAIQETRAEHVWVTSGFRNPMVRWITEQGGDALAVEGQWEEAEP